MHEHAGVTLKERALAIAGACGIARARPVTNPAKTVADCFKHRNKVGLDVAIEALRNCIRHRRATVDELWRLAAVDRVHNVMRPYLQAMM